MQPIIRKHAMQVLLCLMTLLLVGGCSMVRLGYGQLDTIAVWMAHDYFDLNTDQRDAFAQRFERLHAWHRYEQLPEYARFLSDARTRAQRGLRTEDMLWLFDGVKARYGVIAMRAAPEAADLLATLSGPQIESFRRELDKANRKFLRENRTNQSIAERRQAQQRRTLTQLRDWVGPLSSAQEQRINALLQQVPLVDKLRHEDRLNRQRELLAILEMRNEDRVTFTRRIRDWLTQWESGRSPQLAQAFAEAWHRRAEFYAAVDRLLSAEQRIHLAHRLRDFAEDFRQLAERRSTAAKAD